MTTSAFFCLASPAISLALPLPMYVPESTRWRFWRTWPTTFAPAVWAREPSSPSGSRGSAVDFGRITPTSTAFSWRTDNSVRFSSAKVSGPPKSPRAQREGHCSSELAQPRRPTGRGWIRMPRMESSPRSPSPLPEADAPPLVAYLDHLVEELVRLIPMALRDWDDHAIHQSRVATRRLKAGIDLFRP